jgi:hypothetical protein
MYRSRLSNRAKRDELDEDVSSVYSRNDCNIQSVHMNVYRFTVTFPMDRNADEWKLNAFESVIWSSL